MLAWPPLWPLFVTANQLALINGDWAATPLVSGRRWQRRCRADYRHDGAHGRLCDMGCRQPDKFTGSPLREPAR